MRAPRFVAIIALAGYAAAAPACSTANGNCDSTGTEGRPCKDSTGTEGRPESLMVKARRDSVTADSAAKARRDSIAADSAARARAATKKKTPSTKR